MSDDPKTTDPGVSTDPAKTEKTEVDSAELETLKKSQDVMDDLNTEAVELGFTDFGEYKKFLEEKKFNEINAETPPAETPTPATPSTTTPPVTTPPVTTPPVTQSDNGADKKILQSTQLSAQSWLESQYTQWFVTDLARPEDERSSLKKVDIFKLVTGPSGKAIELMSHEKEFEGNLFAAADVYANMKDYREKARKAGAKSQAALNKAGETANLPGGVAPPQPPSGESPEEMNDKLADSIIQDDPPIE